MLCVWRSGTRRRRRSSWSGRSTALPRPAAMMVIRELLDDEDPPLHLLAYLCPRARSWRARSPPSPTSAPASVHSFVPVQGGELRCCVGRPGLGHYNSMVVGAQMCRSALRRADLVRQSCPQPAMSTSGRAPIPSLSFSANVPPPQPPSAVAHPVPSLVSGHGDQSSVATVANVGELLPPSRVRTGGVDPSHRGAQEELLPLLQAHVRGEHDPGHHL
jgi:hypothetical protein